MDGYGRNFLLVGVIFFFCGIFGLTSFSHLYQHEIDYTTCNMETDTTITCGSRITADIKRGKEHPTCQCMKIFDIKEKIGKVFVHYKLSNFYQNHRMYARSSDYKQMGSIRGNADLSRYCEPYHHRKVGNVSRSHPIFPCGRVAHSLFNDTYEIQRHQKNGWTTVSMSKEGIAWPADTANLFTGHPSKDDVAPSTWSRARNITDPDVMVWMRIAASSIFLKPYGWMDRLEAGSYRIAINYSYPVEAFHGKKSVVLSELNLFGSAKSNMHIVSTVYGLICILIGSVLIISPQEHKRLPPAMR